MSTYIHYTEEQKARARQADIVEWPRPPKAQVYPIAEPRGGSP